MRKIKMIAIDLDGTLLKDDKSISERNKEALKFAKESGVQVVICTGRPLKAMDNILSELNLDEEGDYSITFNGGLVQKNKTGEIIAKKVFSLAEVKHLIEIVHQHNLPIDVLSEGVVLQLPSLEKSWYERANPRLEFKKILFTDLENIAIFNKAVTAYEPRIIDALLSSLRNKLAADFEIVKSRDMLLEFLPKGVSKAYGIKKLAKVLNIGMENVMALGDEENDLPMIKEVGLGIAMQNAVPKVLEAAASLTASNEADGVAKAIEKYVL